MCGNQEIWKFNAEMKSSSFIYASTKFKHACKNRIVINKLIFPERKRCCSEDGNGKSRGSPATYSIQSGSGFAGKILICA
jgi:hypothetical protein